MEVADGGRIDEAEETCTLGTVVDADGHGVAVAFEDAAVALAAAGCNGARHGDVGFERCVHHGGTLGRSHLVAEGSPVVGRTYDHEVLVLYSQRRLLRIYGQLDFVVDARACELDGLLADGHLIGREFVGCSIYGGSVAVGGGDEHLHLGAVVPDGSILVGILPFDADGACHRVGPLGTVVLDAQQVEHAGPASHRYRRRIVAHAPQLLGRGAHDDVLHLDAATHAYLTGREGGNERGVLIGVSGLPAFQQHRADGLQVGVLARQRAHDEELVAFDDVGISGIAYLPLQ